MERQLPINVLLWNTNMRTLLQFTKELPSDFVLAPIYRKDAVMESGKPATGKNPVEAAHKRNLNPADAALIVERSSKVGALGVWCGAKGNGLVILDVDRNLSALLKKWGETLSGAPVVRSPKKNAAKYLFRVPEALWGDLAGFGHSDEHPHGYEVLWNKRQALIAGEYPGGGEYTIEGDLHSIPDAPEWLIAEMKAAKVPTGLVKNRSALNLDGRTEEELITIVEECLSVIPNQGCGSRDHWVHIGMAIHSALPGETGLEMWSKWSSEDPEYAQEWEKGNPCEQVWSSFKPGSITLGTLIWHADQVDPDQTRFSVESKRIVEEAKAAIQRWKEVVPDYDEVLKRALAAFEIEDIPRMNYELHKLAIEARYRDQSGIEKLLIDHMTSAAAGQRRSMLERTSERRKFVIPGLLPAPYTVLVAGREGSGKSATVMGLMKHIVDGIPFQLKGQKVPVVQGPVIYFNSDMSAQDFDEEFDQHDVRNTAQFYEQPDFNIYRQAQFIRAMKTIQPVMICIDSLSSCSGSKAADENKAEFAQPLYWLNANNGRLWPPCVIMVLHHASKGSGGFRGSTAIGAAVAEVWTVDKPNADNKLKADQRLVTVGKSRIGRSGERLLQVQNEDFTLSLAEVKKPDEMQTRAGTQAEKILNRLLTSGRPMSLKDLNADSLVGGSVAANRKTIQRMLNRGLIAVVRTEQGSRGGRPEEFYAPVGSSRGETIDVSTSSQTPCAGTDSQVDTPAEVDTCPLGVSDSLERTSDPQVDTCPTEAECPVGKPSPQQGSGPEWTVSPNPHARDVEENRKARMASDKKWKQEYRSVDDVETQPMDSWDSLKTIADFDGCVDITAKELP